MRAIILAAGYGRRLCQSDAELRPKCLLAFGGMSLLERHLRLLRAAGVDDIVLVLGFEHAQVEAELDRLGWTPRPRVVLNAQYRLGSVLSVHCAREALAAGDTDVLLMDADVLYDERMIVALVDGAHANRLLLDRGFEAGDEPVKLCVRNGVPVELRKMLPEALRYDTMGESVGFFRLAPAAAARLAALCARYVETGRADAPHEEALRDLLLEGSPPFEIADVTGSPWIEIDFPADVERARSAVLPRLNPLTDKTTS
jgi:choline kinase